VRVDVCGGGSLRLAHRNVLLDSIMYKTESSCWPAVNPAVEAVDLATIELATALASLLFNEVFLLAEPKG
jgi:hypothetical protein